MQRNKYSLSNPNSNTLSSSSSHRKATTSLRRSLKTAHESDDDDISDPRPWETRGPLNLYGTSKDQHGTAPVERAGSPVGDLPLYEMEARRRTPYGEKEIVAAANPHGPGAGLGMGTEGKELLDDDSGKYGKGFGLGPGVGGRRGLPPRQRRIPGWVSLDYVVKYTRGS